MDFIVNGILCETRPCMSREERAGNIRKFTEKYYALEESVKPLDLQGSINIALGRSLRSVRENIRHTQDELSEVLGTTQSAISFMENGRQPISAFELYRLFDYVPDIDKNIFFGRTGRYTRPTDQKYIYVCSFLNQYGFEFLSDQLDILINRSAYHI